MIAQQVSTSPAVSVFAPPEFVSTGLTARRRQRGGVILDLDDTLYPREQFVLSGFAAVAKHIAAMDADHKGPRRNDPAPQGCGADLHDPRGEGRIAADAAFLALIDAYDGSGRGHEFQALCRRFDLSLDVIPELVAVFREHRPSLWLRPGVVDTLYRLRRDGWRIAILTNGLPSVQAAKIDALGLRRLVDVVLYAEEYAPGGKPAAAAFRAVLSRLNLPASSCIAVGDDPLCDVRGGRAAGLATVRVSRPDVEAPVQHEADVIIDRIEKLPEVAHALVDLVHSDVA